MRGTYVSPAIAVKNNADSKHSGSTWQPQSESSGPRHPGVSNIQKNPI